MMRTAIGISACLAGERVRYDGADKGDAALITALAQHFELIPLCPEVAIGLGVPRPPIALYGAAHSPRARFVHDPASDLSAALIGYADEQARRPAIHGYVFKARSPSCGLRDTPIETTAGMTYGAGLYARTLLASLPGLPAADERELQDAEVLAAFIACVQAHARG
jgi:uncharacterized protein YbbK (DUF523 family)